MSVYSAKTGVSSILKSFSPSERDKAKNAAINKVRFEMHKQMSIVAALEDVVNNEDFTKYNEIVCYLKETDLGDGEFIRFVAEARKAIHLLKPSFVMLVETLLTMRWFDRTDECIAEFSELLVDLLLAHSKFIKFGIEVLIRYWIPTEAMEMEWQNGIPSPKINRQLDIVHGVMERLLTIIPMTFDVVLEIVEEEFPYYKKPSFIYAGYLHNIIRLMEYKSSLNGYLLELIMKQLLILDVNAPRNEIEDEMDDDEMDEDEDEKETDDMFKMDGCDEHDDSKKMSHPVAETLDICMEKMFNYLDQFKSTMTPLNLNQEKTKRPDIAQIFKNLMSAFSDVILPSHNTHHVQFIVYYFCNFRTSLAEKFLSSLWNKVKDPNVSPPIRQASVGYIASFLARSKFVSIVLVKNYLAEFCNFAHQYISRSDAIRSNISLRPNIVFFSICQAVFYVIAFRSRDLTTGKKDLLFLQSLQLSALVTCNFNPLRVCLPAVATAFAGVTRAYQLAYCHTILERNARRKLATVYANDIATPEEILDTFFPFDPYLLKKSGKRITKLYLQYQASEAEEDPAPIRPQQVGRKRGDSEMVEDIDDFIVTDKRQKFADLAKSVEKDMTFTYGLSPGFQM